MGWGSIFSAVKDPRPISPGDVFNESKEASENEETDYEGSG
jgi:hypothetical protein